MAAAPADRPHVGSHPHVAFCLLGADGSVLAARDEHRAFYAASTIKLHVLIAALRAADAGRLDLAAAVPATATSTGIDGRPYTLDGDHLDPTHPAVGTPLPIRELLVRMIDRSSNEATNAVIDLIGLDAVAEAIAALGLRCTRVERRIGDTAALAAGLTNETTAADLATTLRRLTTGGLVSAAGTSLALGALRAQRIPVISAALRPGVDTGSKSGEIEGIRHDVAFIGTPDGPQARFLAVLTSGYDRAQGDEVVRAVTAALAHEACA